MYIYLLLEYMLSDLRVKYKQYDNFKQFSKEKSRYISNYKQISLPLSFLPLFPPLPNPSLKERG